MDIIQDKVIITHKLHGQAPGDISYIHQIFPLKQKRTHYTVKERERERRQYLLHFLTTYLRGFAHYRSSYGTPISNKEQTRV